jgi:hypothetical protein
LPSGTGQVGMGSGLGVSTVVGAEPEAYLPSCKTGTKSIE